MEDVAAEELIPLHASLPLHLQRRMRKRELALSHIRRRGTAPRTINQQQQQQQQQHQHQQRRRERSGAPEPTVEIFVPPPKKLSGGFFVEAGGKEEPSSASQPRRAVHVSRNGSVSIRGVVAGTPAFLRDDFGGTAPTFEEAARAPLPPLTPAAPRWAQPQVSAGARRASPPQMASPQQPQRSPPSQPQPQPQPRANVHISRNGSVSITGVAPSQMVSLSPPHVASAAAAAATATFTSSEEEESEHFIARIAAMAAEEEAADAKAFAAEVTAEDQVETVTEDEAAAGAMAKAHTIANEMALMKHRAFEWLVSLKRMQTSEDDATVAAQEDGIATELDALADHALELHVRSEALHDDLGRHLRAQQLDEEPERVDERERLAAKHGALEERERRVEEAAQALARERKFTAEALDVAREEAAREQANAVRAALVARNDALASATDEHGARSAELEAHIREQSAEIERLRESHRAVENAAGSVAMAAQSEVGKLKALLAEEQERTAALEAALTTARGDSGRLRERIDAEMEEMQEEMGSRMDALVAERDAAQTDAAAAGADSERLRANVGSEMAQMQDEMDGQLDALAAERDAAQADADAAREDSERLRTNVGSEMAQMQNELAYRIDALVVERDTALERERAAAADVEAIARDRDAAMLAARAAAQDAEDAHPVLQAAVSRLQSEVREAMGQVAVLTADLAIASRGARREPQPRTQSPRSSQRYTAPGPTLPPPPQLSFSSQILQQKARSQPSPPPSPFAAAATRETLHFPAGSNVHVNRHGSITLNQQPLAQVRQQWAPTTTPSKGPLAAMRSSAAAATQPSPLFTPTRADPLTAQLAAMRAFRQRYQLDERE